ncbi:MAG: phosphate ABC transporter substrate-binding protein, partial [Calothrix sp. SM1_7_51]|nr:phosphate ABC transporter substrate-binding protein [Calothrix sp. SM1_7_51]
MAQRSGPPPIIYILLLLILGGFGYWWFVVRPSNPATIITPTPSTPQIPPISSSGVGSCSLPAGTTVRIDGSTSMVTINEKLKQNFQTICPNAIVATNAQGTTNGIQGLISGSVDVAAISRPLSSQEQAQGLVAVPVATDKIAVIIGTSNPFNGNFTNAQVSDIFQGKINNWSAVGGSSATIRVINRPSISGTHQSFKELALKGANFGTTPNIITLPRDETTGLIRLLGLDGIG